MTDNPVGTVTTKVIAIRKNPDQTERLHVAFHLEPAFYPIATDRTELLALLFESLRDGVSLRVRHDARTLEILEAERV